MPLLTQVLATLDQALQLQGRALQFDANTPLLGALPELDSMSAVALISALETQFGIIFDDSDLNADTFVNVGTLCQLVERALG
jgi:acyl carrier protein